MGLFAEGTMAAPGPDSHATLSGHGGVSIMLVKLEEGSQIMPEFELVSRFLGRLRVPRRASRR